MHDPHDGRNLLLAGLAVLALGILLAVLVPGRPGAEEKAILGGLEVAGLGIAIAASGLLKIRRARAGRAG